MALSEFQRAVISRAAMAVMGAALLYGGWACLAVADRLHKDNLERVGPSGNPDSEDGSGLPSLIGEVLFFVGVPFAMGAVLPNRVLYAVLRPSPVGIRGGLVTRKRVDK